MGDLYRVECLSCGYSDEVAEGAGMAGATYRPMACSRCRRVVAVLTSSMDEAWVTEAEVVELNACPCCGSRDVTRWGDFPHEGETSSGNCPRCKATTELESIGLWD